MQHPNRGIFGTLNNILTRIAHSSQAPNCTFVKALNQVDPATFDLGMQCYLKGLKQTISAWHDPKGDGCQPSEFYAKVIALILRKEVQLKSRLARKLTHEAHIGIFTIYAYSFTLHGSLHSTR